MEDTLHKPAAAAANDQTLLVSDQFITQVKQLVAIRSTNDNPAGLQQAVDYVASLLEGYEGITVERFTHNNYPSFLAYYGATRPKKFDVLFNAHVDVVPGKASQFKPHEKNGRLYGRGVYDMKAAAVVMTEVFREYGDSSPLTVGLQVVSDEEVGGYSGTKLQLEDGVKADFAITGEMTDGGICNEARGMCWVELAFDGRTAHGGYPWRGDNAVTKASAFAHALLRKYPVPNNEQWTTTVNIAALTTGNKTFNRVPDKATLKLDFRFTPEDPYFYDTKGVRTLIASIDPDATVVAIHSHEASLLVEKSNPYLQQLRDAYKKVTGEQAKLIKRYASSDGRHCAQFDIPCVEYGLTGADHHADHEYIELSSVPVYKKTLETFLLHRP